MRRLMILSIAALAAAVSPASASHGSADWVHTDTILLANPTTQYYAGITEQVSPCGGSIDPDVPAGSGQGIDGSWFELPVDAAGHAATLTATGLEVPDPVGLVPGVDVDAWFYDDACSLITPSEEAGAYHMATTGSLESGVVPQTAFYVVVDLVVGANATYTFTVKGMPEADGGS